MGRHDRHWRDRVPSIRDESRRRARDESLVIIRVGIDIDAPAMAVFDAVADPAMSTMDHKIEPRSERVTR